MESIAAKGRAWEELFARLAKRKGFDVCDVSRERLPYDFIVNNLRVQCKSLTWTDRSKDQVRIARGGTGSMRAYLLTDIDAFALCINRQVYILPAEACEDPRRAGQCRLKLYRTWIKPWRDQWSVFEQSLEPSPVTHQIDLF